MRLTRAIAFFTVGIIMLLVVYPRGQYNVGNFLYLYLNGNKVQATAGTATITVPNSTDTLVGKATTDTLTNKTLDAESTGNVLTLPFTLDVPVSNCTEVGGNGWSNWDNVASSDNVDQQAEYHCDLGVSSPLGALLFADGGLSSIYYAYNHMMLPSDWTGTVALRIWWATGATTGNIVWQLQTACYGTGADFGSTSWNTVQTVTSAANATAYRTIQAAFTSVTTTGCSAGNMFKYRLFRDTGNVGDTVAGYGYLQAVEWTYRRAI